MSAEFNVVGLHRVGIAIALACTLLGCGGGGGGGSGITPSQAAIGSASVSSMAAGSWLADHSFRYGQMATLTINGSNLSANALSISANGCTAPSGTPPTSSSAAPTNLPTPTSTQVTYYCILNKVGAGQFTVTQPDGTQVGTVSFTVPKPQVTLLIGNGQGISGALVITLFAEKAPLTVTNFLNYVNSRFYDGTIFHRISPVLNIIQAGGYASGLSLTSPVSKVGNPPIALESTTTTGLSNIQWAVSMARGATDASATSQFFLNISNNSSSLDATPPLGNGYAVFGTINTGATATASIATANSVFALAANQTACISARNIVLRGECVPVPNVTIQTAQQTQ